MRSGSHHWCFSYLVCCLFSVPAAAPGQLPRVVNSDGKDMDASRGHVRWLDGRNWDGKGANFPRFGGGGWT